MGIVDPGKGGGVIPPETVKAPSDLDQKEDQVALSKLPVTINISLPPGTRVTISSHSISPIEEEEPSKVTKSFQEEVIEPKKQDRSSEELMAKSLPEMKEQEIPNQEVKVEEAEDTSSFQPSMEEEDIEEDSEEEEDVNGSTLLKTTESEESSDSSDSNQEQPQEEEPKSKKKKRHLEPNREALLSIAKGLMAAPDPREKVLQEDPFLKKDLPLKAEKKETEPRLPNYPVYEELSDE